MKHVSDLRKEFGWTQIELANRLGISQQAISKYEKEERDPDIDVLVRMAKLFNVSTDYLLGVTTVKTVYRAASYSKDYAKSHEEMGNSINYWTGKSGYGNDELANMLGVTEKLFDDFCAGREFPSLEILLKLSEICNVSTDCLLGLRSQTRQPSEGEMPFRFDPEISRRLKEQAAVMEENYGFIASVLGIEESEVFNFFEYGFVPHISIFAKIVEHFLISSDYLLNRSNSTLTIQADEDELLRSYRMLNAKSKTMALSRIYELEREESLVAAKDRYLDSEGKSLPSSGTGGNTMVG